jgi:hypothetical protein
MSKSLRRSDGTFAPGWSGGGRPKGSRSRLSEIALAMLAENFAKHGEETIEQVRQTMPHIYLKIIAGLLPKQLSVERTSHQPISRLEAAHCRRGEAAAGLLPLDAGAVCAGDGCPACQ